MLTSKESYVAAILEKEELDKKNLRTRIECALVEAKTKGTPLPIRISAERGNHVKFVIVEYQDKGWLIEEVGSQQHGFDWMFK